MTSKPCTPGKHCERHARGLGACVAGYCNPPAPGARGRLPPVVILDHVGNVPARKCIACGAVVLPHEQEECPHA